MKSPKVVFDTNVLVLAFEAELAEGRGQKPDSYRQTAATVVAFVFNQHAAYITAETLTELEQVVTGGRFRERHPGQDRSSQSFYNRVRENAWMVAPGQSANRCWRDKSDTKFLHAVNGAEADYLVTEDYHLLAIKCSDGARILRIRDFAVDVMGVSIKQDSGTSRPRKNAPPPPSRAFETVSPPKPKIVRDAYGRPKKQEKASTSTVRTSPTPPSKGRVSSPKPRA